MARASGVSPAKVHQIWQAAGLAPHRLRRFKLSTDPAFAAKVEDVVGLYVAPPKHAIVLSVDEKSQIQALDRTQPGLPMKPGRLGTMTHDYKRNGTTTLFAALDVLDGTVIGRCMQRHRHQEFIRFLNAIERHIPAGKVIHVILDNYAAHKHPNVREWLARHPALDLPLHADLLLVAQRRRGLLRQADQAPPQTRHLPIPGQRCKRPSTASSSTTTRSQLPSPGKPIPKTSSPPPSAGIKRYRQSTSSLRCAMVGIRAPATRRARPQGARAGDGEEIRI